MRRHGFVLMEGLIVITILMVFLVLLFKLGMLAGGWLYILCIPGALFAGFVVIFMVIGFVGWCYFAFKQLMWKLGWGPPPPPPCKTWM